MNVLKIQQDILKSIAKGNGLYKFSVDDKNVNVIYDSAKKLIDRIAGNGWITPNGIVPNLYKPETIKSDVSVWA